MLDNTEWVRAVVGRVAGGMGLFVIPRDKYPPSRYEIRRYGTLVALEVVGTWHWVAKSDGSAPFRFVRDLSTDELARVKGLRVCEDRLDLARQLTVREME